MLTDGIVGLYRTGAIDGSRKTVMPGPSCAPSPEGPGRSTTSSTTIRWSPSAPRVHQRSGVIGQNDNVWPSTARSDRPHRPGRRRLDRPALFSGIGGQVDFIRGAARSRGGRPIIALRARPERHGEPHRADPVRRRRCRDEPRRRAPRRDRARPRQPVRHGRPRASARAISIAHPAFREELERRAHELRLTWKIAPADGHAAGSVLIAGRDVARLQRPARARGTRPGWSPSLNSAVI